MMLNEDGKNELREKIIEQLKNVPDGQRVHLDKELLESLLFQTITYNKNTNEKLKLPIWSGDFLRKIDLSEVSFEDVSWSLIVDEGWDYPEEEFIEFMDEETYEKMPDILSILDPDILDNKVDYSYTNANIDFSKSFEFKKTGKIKLLFCDFSGVDLSKNDMSKIGSVFYCDLADTGIMLSPEMFANKRGSVFGSTCLKNVDLSKFSVSAIDLMRDKYILQGDCDFTNTGLNVSVNPTAEEWNNDENKWVKNEFNKMMTRLCGCYVNGKLVHTEEEKQAIAQEKREEYEKMKDEIIGSTLGSIDEQVSHMKR